jgi:hypothetical protein
MENKKISIKERYERLIELIEISKTVVSQSAIIEDDEKRVYTEGYEFNLQEAKAFYEDNNHNALKQIEREVLTPWNESMDEDSVAFWKIVSEKGIGLQQENKIEKILKRGYIKNFAEYELVQDAIVIYEQEGRITREEVLKLSRMLGSFEEKQNRQ